MFAHLRWQVSLALPCVLESMLGAEGGQAYDMLLFEFLQLHASLLRIISVPCQGTFGVCKDLLKETVLFHDHKQLLADMFVEFASEGVSHYIPSMAASGHLMSSSPLAIILGLVMSSGPRCSVREVKRVQQIAAHTEQRDEMRAWWQQMLDQVGQQYLSRSASGRSGAGGTRSTICSRADGSHVGGRWR